MNGHHRIILSLCVFSVIYSLFFVKIYRYPVLGDERTYYAYGLNLYKGNGYSYQESAPFEESNLREPAYPFFIYMVFKIFGVSKGAIQVSQAFLNGIIVLCAYILAKSVFNDARIALTAASLAAISPAIAGYPAFIASETLATLFLMLASLSFLALLKARGGGRGAVFSILTGLFCGCLALTKMAYLLLFPLVCFLLFMAPERWPVKSSAVLLTLAVFVSVLIPWFSFNNRIYGNPFFLTNRGGITITAKAQRLKWTPKEAAVSFIYSISEGLVEKYFPVEYKKVTYGPVEGSAFKASYDKYDSLINRGYGEMAADKQMRSDALREIKANFLKYVILSVSDLHFMLYFEGLPLSQFTDFFKRGLRMAINSFFKLYSLVIIFLGVKGVFVLFRQKERASIKTVFLLPVFYTFFIYSAIFGAPRFTFTIIPFIYILASAGFWGAFKGRAEL